MTVPTRELRHDIPAEIMGVLDGIALARGITRGELVAAILRKETEQAVHEATVVLRFARGNGAGLDIIRSGPE